MSSLMVGLSRFRVLWVGLYTKGWKRFGQVFVGEI